MNVVLYIIYISFNLIGTLFFRIKLNYLKRYGTKEELDKYISTVVAHWARKAIKILKIKVNIIGMENLPEGNCLFVANHQGNFDFFAMLGFLDKPMGFIAKKEIAKLPIVYKWMRDIHCVFIDRESPRESLKAINEGIENLKNGYSMVIFPEGTRSKGHKMGEFKKGSLKMALKAKVPVVPVTLEGSYNVYEAIGGNKLMPAVINVVVDKPIDVTTFDKEQQKNLSEIVKDVIEKNLKQFD